MQQSSINPFSLVVFLSVCMFMPVFSGCTTLVSPYSTTFQCPDSDKGKCVSVQTAYNESVETNPLVREPAEPACDNGEDGTDQKNRNARGHEKESGLKELKYHYQDSLYKKMTAILEQPETPFVIAPDVIRVLIPSYTGSDNALYGSRYVYFFVTDPQWSLSSATVDTDTK